MTGDLRLGPADISAAAADDLEFEMLAAAARCPFAAARRVVDLGGDPGFVARLHGAGDLGVARVELVRGGSAWEPEGPDQRLLLAVRDGGELLDLVALSSQCRDEWALRTGDGWALGIDHFRAIEGGDPDKRASLRLFANPFAWLAAAGAGLCVLEWNTTALSALRSLGERVTLRCEPAGKDNLRAMLAHGGLPRVEAVRDGMRRVA